MESKGFFHRCGVVLDEALDVVMGASAPGRSDVDVALVEANESSVGCFNGEGVRDADSRPSKPIGIETLTSIGCYEGSMASLLAVAKYSAIQGVLHRLGIRLGVELCATATWLECARMRPVVIPAPMPKWRQAHRGIDHARVIAHGVASEIGGVVRAWLSSRWRPPQVGSDRGTRKAISDCISPSWRWRAERQMAGRRRLDACFPVILVDDVLTTGSTMTACAQVLQDLGLERIHGGVLLRKEGS